MKKKTARVRLKRSRDEIDRRKRVTAAKRLLGKKVNYFDRSYFVVVNQKIPTPGSRVTAIDVNGMCKLVSTCCEHDFGWWTADCLDPCDTK